MESRLNSDHVPALPPALAAAPAANPFLPPALPAYGRIRGLVE